MPIANEKLIDQYSIVHRKKRYGGGPNQFALHIQTCLLDLKPKTILEYGCGQSKLHENLILDGVCWVSYDPAIPKLSEIHIKEVDFIINTDVLEHIPEADIDDVLQHIKSLSKYVFFNISTRPAKEILPDGTNAHCTIWPAGRWLEKIQKFFPDATLVHVRPNYSCLLVTWKSPVVQILAQIEELSIFYRIHSRPVLKRIDNAVRVARSKLLNYFRK